jgi:predicted lipoprotein with Yx(FWY)xxD motif
MPPDSRRRTRPLAIVLGVLAIAATAATGALGASVLTLGRATNQPLGQTVVVNPAGRTLYSLSGESARRLLCKSSECARFWPPLLVPSHATRLKAATGVQGKLGLIRRPNGSMQVTLRGKPLYRYSGDTGADQAHGQDIRSFGGVWLAVTASTAATAPPAPPAPTSPPESSMPYSY